MVIRPSLARRANGWLVNEERPGLSRLTESDGTAGINPAALGGNAHGLYFFPKPGLRMPVSNWLPVFGPMTVGRLPDPPVPKLIRSTSFSIS
jgi:hypothetical protein